MSSTPPELETPAATRPAPPLTVARLDTIGETIARIDRHVVRARRDATALLLLSVAMGPVPASDGPGGARRKAELAQALARRLRSQVRSTDDVWQFADEEWVALLPGCRAEFARGVRRRLVSGLGAPYRLQDGMVGVVPRIGVACLMADTSGGAALLAAAHAALDADEVLAVGRRVA